MDQIKTTRRPKNSSSTATASKTTTKKKTQAAAPVDPAVPQPGSGTIEEAVAAGKSKKAAPKKKAATGNAAHQPWPESNGKIIVSPEEKWRMIAECAYYRAERRGFASEGTECDWFEAEREIGGKYLATDELAAQGIS